MRETSKAQARRLADKKFPWKLIFSGCGVDIGSGDDPLNIEGCEQFDFPKDANKFSSYYPPQSLDWLHSSNCLEHLHNPTEALADWIKTVKKGGHIVFTVPECILYGDMLWDKPKMFNADHKATFSMWLKGSPAPRHYVVPKWIKEIEKECNVKSLKCALIDTNYDYSVMFNRDQTFDFLSGVECFIETVLEVK